VKRGHFDVVRLLIKHGGDTGLKNIKGETPIDVANKFKPRRLRHEMQALISKCIEGSSGNILQYTQSFLYWLSIVIVVDFVKPPVISTAEVLRLNRLAGLCKAWGAIKYAHPSLQYV
jgi:hypothetical protein